MFIEEVLECDREAKETCNLIFVVKSFRDKLIENCWSFKNLFKNRQLIYFSMARVNLFSKIPWCFILPQFPEKWNYKNIQIFALLFSSLLLNKLKSQFIEINCLNL